MLKLHDIRRLHVELTTRCNARCPMCMRNYRGYDYNSGYPDCELSLADFKHIAPPSLLTQLNHNNDYAAKGVSFNGNLGDFASAKEGLEIVQYLVQHNVPVWINSNGSVRTPDWWAKLAMPGVTVGFALDGLADTHHLYRQDTDWHRVIMHAEAFIKAGGQAIWRFVPFDHNRHQEPACRKMAKEMGFKEFENIYDGRHSTPVFTRTGQYSHQIGKHDIGATLTPDITTLLHGHVTWYDAKTFRHVKDTPDLWYDCIHKKNKEIYIAADGSVYPCCYLGFYPGQMLHPGNQELAKLVRENNALLYPLEHCLAWFDSVEEAWSRTNIADGRPYQCVSTCGKI